MNNEKSESAEVKPKSEDIEQAVARLEAFLATDKVKQAHLDNYSAEYLKFIISNCEDSCFDNVSEVVSALWVSYGLFPDMASADDKLREILPQKVVERKIEAIHTRELLDERVNIVDGMKGVKEDRLVLKGEISYVNEEELKKEEEKQKERNAKRAMREAMKLKGKHEKLGIVDAASTIHCTKASSAVMLSNDIHAENFSMNYGKLSLLENTTLNIVGGRRYGLVGRNGCGKSTLMRHIAKREIEFNPNLSILHVEQEIRGDDTTVFESVLAADTERTRLLAEEKRLIETNPGSQLLQQIYTRLAEIGAYDAESRVHSILTGLSFTEEMKSTPTKNFSGGWRMRIALARALFMEPDYLLLDEPTNHLDFHALVWLENFLANWKKTLLIVSHQRDFINGVVTDIIHLANKKLNYYHGNYDSFEKIANERIRQQQAQYDAQELQKKHMQKFIDRFRFNAKRASLVQSRLKMLDKMTKVDPVVEEGAVVLSFPDPDTTEISPPILGADGVEFGFTPEKILFRNVNFSIDLDSRIAIVGPNGCGKTTLLKLLTGELVPLRGQIIRNGKVRYAVFNQNFVDNLSLPESALEYFHRIFPDDNPQELRAQLGRFGISGDTALQPMRTLSGGQKSRVVFAELAYRRPHLLLLDEPTNHLDIETIEGLARSLSTWQGGIVMVSHDQRLISMVCDEVWSMEDHKLSRWNGDLISYKKHIEAEIFADKNRLAKMKK